MSISKRLLDLARSNLTDFRTAFTSDGLRDLLHREEPAEAQAEQPDEGVDGETLGKKAGRKARRFKDAAEEAWERAYENARVRAGVRGEPLSDPAADRKRWYRTLELQPGADLKEVRRAYRKMLLQYHPDRYANDPEKYKVATEVTRKLTEAYNGLQQTLA
jgi:DnaJ-domain-containing protein 1